MLRRLALALAVTTASSAFSQAILHPNTVAVTTRFTNADPAIRAYLDAPRATWSGRLDARSVDAALNIGAYTQSNNPDRARDAQQITVESSAAGIPYRVLARQVVNDRESYRFAQVVSPPVVELPAPPVPVDAADCLTLVRICFRDAAGTPVTVTHADVSAWPDADDIWWNEAQARIKGDSVTEMELGVRADGGTGTIRIDLVSGTDPFHDRIVERKEFRIQLECDRIVELGCGAGGGFCNGAGGGGLGAIVGRFDVVGEDEIPSLELSETQPWAHQGPFGNERKDLLTAPASGPFELESLVPSGGVPYRVDVNYGVRLGRSRNSCISPRVLVDVPASTTVDLGDTFVMTPGFAAGDIELAGPAGVPGLGAPLSRLKHVDDATIDPDGDGVPYSENGFALATSLTALRPAAGAYGSAVTGIPGATDPTSGTFTGRYELVLAHLAPPDEWNLNVLRTAYEAKGTPDVPVSYLDGLVDASDLTLSGIAVAPGAHVEVDRDECFGLVRVAFAATSGTLYNPELSIRAYEPPALDYLGRRVNRQCSGRAFGTPVTQSAAAPAGLVQILVPEGEYVLSPSMSSTNPDGTFNRAEVLPVTLGVSCRQVVDAFPDLGITMAALPGCADAGPMTVRATVTSSHAIARAWAVAEDGVEVPICASCGVNPVLDATVMLSAGPHEVQVHVVDDTGREAIASAGLRATVEPSALDVRPGATPLRVTRSAAGLALTWEDASGQEASVYQGTIASLRAGAYDHAGFGACGITSARLDTPAPPRDVYYLVAGSCDWGDTPTGRDSSGRLRPAALDRCR